MVPVGPEGRRAGQLLLNKLGKWDEIESFRKFPLDYIIGTNVRKEVNVGTKNYMV
jgi:hypothetical protein